MGRIVITSPDAKGEACLNYEDERDLYIAPSPNFGYQFPDIYTEKGELVFPIDLAKGELSSIIESGAGKMANNMALVKLSKGFMIDNRNGVHYKTKAGEQRLVFEKTYYTIEGNEITVKQGKNFGNKYVTTKGINQFQSVSEFCFDIKIIRFIGKTANIYDIFGSVASLHDRSKPFSFPSLGGWVGFSVFFVFAYGGYIAQSMHNEIMADLEEERHKSLRNAITEGLGEESSSGGFMYSSTVGYGVRKWLQNDDAWNKTYNGYDEDGIYYDLKEISAETANKILQGEFKTWDEMQQYDDMKSSNNNVYILYRQQPDKDRNIDIYTIETFFIGD